MTNYSQLYFRRMTGGYSEGFNMSEVMECRSTLRPTPNSENQMLLLHSVDTPISPRKKESK
ncbi:hypothetical protein NC651_040348 [Populus alba x Populus x berolinensis]|nr:hypothetical protein NC651_040348 [Populus alba x Populus x berolinensis]